MSLLFNASAMDKSPVGKKELLEVYRGDIRNGAGEATKAERRARVAALAALEEQSAASDIDDGDASYKGTGSPLKGQRTPAPKRRSWGAQAEEEDIEDDASDWSELTPPPSPAATLILEDINEAAGLKSPSPSVASGAPSFVMQPGGLYHIRPTGPASVRLSSWEKVFYCACAVPVFLEAFVTFCLGARARYFELSDDARNAAAATHEVLNVLIDRWLVLFQTYGIPLARLVADGVVWGIAHAVQISVLLLTCAFLKCL